MRLTLVQPGSGTDININLDFMEDTCTRAAADRADLVVFPEYSTYEKDQLDQSFVDAAQPLDGPAGRRLAGMAARNRTALVAGVIETSDEPGRAFNTLLALGADGGQLAAYRKIHLFDCQGFQESRFIKPSPDLRPVTFTCGGIVVGLMTCYDLRFPELARALADAGAQVLLVCSSWVPGPLKVEHWTTLARARAIENGVYVAAVTQAAPVSIGRSMLVDPLGVVVRELGAAPESVTVEVDAGAVAAAREQFPTWSHHRLPA
jgi:deaminated glutathione amidase